ncbi:MAG TPA: hypothetical protein VM940_14465 [Chthoniobacterales bacterium]|jgi:hypothetical protein|nr:hypothetical protein [Chthoniobacterales bacterium]
MSAYFQMGHDSENLVGAVDLEEFAGAILSPVNRGPQELASFVPKARLAGVKDIILDPQFYFPRTARGKLGQHVYFPQDFDTTDYSSDSWWAEVIDALVAEGKQLVVDGIATPVICPKVWDDKYWVRCISTFDQLKAKLERTKTRPLFTAFVNINSLHDPHDVLRLASIISESRAKDVLLILVTEIEPRREITDDAGLSGFMHLVYLLGQTSAVTVSYTCSDVVLYKAAGATNCATGKFFNLRRFTSSRFDDSEQGGGQIPYWFEPNLLAFLREADVLRLKRFKLDSMFVDTGAGSIWTAHIEQNLAQSPPGPWLAESWRQYLSSFGKIEKRVAGVQDTSTVAGWLKDAENRWKQLEERGIIMDEERNDGRWIRPWRQALQEFRLRIDAA